MFEDFTPKLKNVTKDKASTEDVKTLQKSSLRWQRPSAEKFGKRHLSGMRPSKKEGSFFQK